MAFTPDDPATLQAAQLARYQNRFPTKAVTDLDFLGKLAIAEGQGQWSQQLKMQRIALDAIPSSSSTYAALADWATTLGLSDGDGGRGPLKATVATGGKVTATGTNGSTITAGTQLAAPNGSTLFQVTALATISGGVADVSLEALTPGTAGNLASPTALRFISPPLGVDSTAAIQSAFPLTGGTDLESATHLWERIQDRLHNPPKPGTPAYLRQVAEGSLPAPDGTSATGIARAFVYLRRDGTGTFAVYLFQSGTGATRADVPADTITSVAGLLAQISTTTERVTVTVAQEDAGHAIIVHVVPTSLYPWDWTDPGTLTVANYNAGAKTLQLSATAPVTLVAGKTVAVSTTGVVLPVVTGPVASISGGDTLHFTELPDEWTDDPPQVGDEVHPGASFVTPIAEAILAAIDALGPSLVSGTADEVTDSWSDSIDQFTIARIAMDVTDSQGRRYLSTLASQPSIDGSTVAGVQAADDGSGTGAPYFLTASSIQVIP